MAEVEPRALQAATRCDKSGGIIKLTVETEQETDGRWIAEIAELPGVMKYGGNRDEAVAQAEALALRVIADRIEHGEYPVEPIEITFVTA